MNAAIIRWLAAVLIALLLSAAHLLDGDPEALQEVADAKADAIAQAARGERP